MRLSLSPLSLLFAVVCAGAIVACPSRPPEEPVTEPRPGPTGGNPNPPPDPPPAPPKMSYSISGGRLALPAAIQFETASATLRPESDQTIDFIKGFLDAKPDITLLRIEGHVDDELPPNEAHALTEQRALAVAKTLVQRGIACSRLIPVGFGADKPIDGSGTPEGRAINRRIEVMPASLRGHAIGGMPIDGGGRVAGNPC